MINKLFSGLLVLLTLLNGNPATIEMVGVCPKCENGTIHKSVHEVPTGYYKEINGIKKKEYGVTATLVCLNCDYTSSYSYVIYK